MAKKPRHASPSIQDQDLPESENVDLEIVYTECEDLIWGPAMMALNGYTRQGPEWIFSGKHNTRAIGELLASGSVPPADVLLALGNMLAPPDGYRGSYLVPRKPKKRDWRASVKGLGEQRKAKLRFQQLKLDGVPFESAVVQIRSEFRRSRGWVTKAIKISDKELVHKASKWLGTIREN